MFAGGQSVPGGSRRPAQQRRERLPARRDSGPFAVDVRATNIAGDGVPGNADTTDQDYALVVSNANPATGPVLVHELATTTETATATA